MDRTIRREDRRELAAGHETGKENRVKKCIHLPLETIIAFSLAMPLCTVSSSATSLDDDVKIISGSARRDQQAAAGRLQSGGAEAVSALVRGLKGSPPETKKELLRFLKGISISKKHLTLRDEDARDLAQQARAEKDRRLRYHMVDNLGMFGGTAALMEVKRFAADDAEEVIRINATRAVDLHEDPDIAFFKNQMKDKSRSVRLTAAMALAERGDKSGRDLALETLKVATSRDDRRDAIWLLGEIGNQADVDFLNNLAASKNEEYVCQNLAKQSLKTMELLKLPPSSRLDFLITSLDDSDILVREWADSKLWRSKEPETDRRLKDYLKEPGHKGYKEAAHAIDSR